MPCVRKLARLAYLVFLPCVAQRRTPGSGRMETNVTTAASTKRNINVFLLGLAFMLMFTAFQTMGNVQTTILNSARNNQSDGYVEGFDGSGQTSLAIIYVFFAAFNWIAPSVVAVLGPRIQMGVGGLAYASFIAQFYKPNTVALYALSAVLGVGAALIWTAQGNFLTLNSDEATMSRNSGIFWAMLQFSMVIGNTFVFIQFQGLTDIDTHTRSFVVIVLLVVCCVGVFTLGLLRKPPSDELSEGGGSESSNTPLQALKGACRLFVTPNMALLSALFFYTGIELTFWSGVYGPAIGSTLAFGSEAKSLVGMHGIFVGLGEFVGGLLFGILGSHIVKRGRDPVVALGFVVHSAAAFGVFLNIPDTAPLGDTNDVGFIEANKYLAIACSFLLGFGDACFNTQIFSILGSVYKDNSAAAFAIFKFVQSFAAAAAFFYAQHAPLYYQLSILFMFNILGTACFMKVELSGTAASSNANNGVGATVEVGATGGGGDGGHNRNESGSQHSDDALLG